MKKKSIKLLGIFLLSFLVEGCTKAPSSAQKRPVLTTAGIVHICPANKIVLIERGKAPEGIALFGGHVENESPLHAFKREAGEELGITHLHNIKLIGVHGEPGRDPRQHSVEITYTCTTPDTPKAGSDAKKTILYTYPELKQALQSHSFAFDHKEILQAYLNRLGTCNPCQQQCLVGLDLKASS